MPERAASRIRIECDGDGLAVSLRYEPSGESCDDAQQEIQAGLLERGVLDSSLDKESVERAVSRIASDPGTGFETRIAHGTAPVHGRDASFQLDASLAEQLAQIANVPDDGSDRDIDEDADEEDVDSAADHYNRSAYVIVAEGDTLGEFLPPTEGDDGVDVFGRTIAAKAGKRCQIEFGPGVEILDDGRVVASCGGSLRARASSVKVEEALRISGNVDFATGNIDFPGSVLVNKDIKDCFIVRARDDLIVYGMVEAARLFVGGSVILKRGMAAREKGTLSVAKDLEAHYLSNVEGSIRRHCSVVRELNGCTLRIGGDFRARRAAVIGGRLEIGKFAQVGQLGGENEITTEIYLGRAQSLEGQAHAAVDLLKQMRLRHADVERHIEELRNAQGARNSHAAAEELTELEMMLDTFATREGPVQEGLSRLADTLERFESAPLEITEMVHPGVVLVLGGWRCKITQALMGPVRITAGESGPVVTDMDGGAEQPLGGFGELSREAEGSPAETLRRAIQEAA